jgi:hypothetical protein
MELGSTQAKLSHVKIVGAIPMTENFAQKLNANIPRSEQSKSGIIALSMHFKLL